MKFVAFKVIDAKNASSLTPLLKQGFTVAAAGSSVIPAVASNGHESPTDETNGKSKTARRRRLRAPRRVTPEMRAEMTALREKGKIWRLIGKRYGVCATRAYQIVNGLNR